MKRIGIRLWTGLALPLAVWPCGQAEAALDIGGRRELFVDNALIAKTAGGLRLALHSPERKEIVFVTDQPWEGNASAFQSMLFVDGKYRMYYRGLQYGPGMGAADATLPEHPWVLCYAESTNGIAWMRPSLGLCEFQGSYSNNIILNPAMVQSISGDPAHTSVFYDANPACPADQKYKMAIVGHGGLYVLGSGDGLSFRVLGDTPCATDGAFDSQNLIFWDPAARTYRAYYRNFRNGIRDILTAASTNVLSFPPGKQVAREQGQEYALYTNQMQPYYRAPHIILGFPMRYTDRGAGAWAWPAMRALPGPENRKARYAVHPRYGTVVTDTILLASRDGETVRLWEESFLYPGPRQQESWVYGDNFVFWGLVETASHLGDAPNEISFYSTEGYWEGDSTKIRRSTLRLDGFVSAQAPTAGGELVTRPLLFAGDELSLNFATGGAGELKVELQGEDGAPIPGYTLAECFPLFGDHVDFPVSWTNMGTDVSALTGTPVCLRFTLKDAYLYSFQFRKAAAPTAILYTAEGDATNATDKLVADGKQNGAFATAGVTVSAGNPRFGSRAFHFADADGGVLARDVLCMPGTRRLGQRFTLAAQVDTAGSGPQRLFSSWRGTGAILADELLFDFDPDGSSGFTLRFYCNGVTTAEGVKSAVPFGDGLWHHLAATYDSGEIRLYLDGVQVGVGTNGAGAVTLGHDLQVGEDVTASGGNEQLLGDVDDIVLLPARLEPADIGALATAGAQQLLGAALTPPKGTALSAR